MTDQDRSSRAADPSAGSTGSPQAGSGQDLRQKAEARAGEEALRTTEYSAAISPEETRKTLHELRVHQIELEMQNEELRKAQAELEASRARYFDLFDLAPGGYLTLCEKGLIREANLTAAALLGVERRALAGSALSRFIPAEDQNIYYLHTKRLFAAGRPQTCELRLLRQGAEPFHARLEAVLAQEEGGAPICRCVVVDITERKQDEEKLRASEAIMSASQRIGHIGSWVLELSSNQLTWSDEVYRIFGIEPQAFGATYEAFLDRIHPDDRSAVDAAYTASVRERAGAYEIEHRIVRLDTGEVRHVHERGHHEYDAAGAVLRSVGMVQDITDRKRAEEALRQSQEKFRQYFENAPNFIYIISTEGTILDANPAAVRVLGYSSKDELIGRPLIGTVYAASSRDKARELLQSWRETGKLENEELRIVTGAGEERTIILNVSSVRDGHGQLIHSVSFQTDITDIKRAEVERENLQNQLRQAQKMESVGRLAGGVAHDFNNMLAVILGHTEMALEQVDPAQPIHADLTGIHKAAGRSADLIRQLLAFARKQTIAPRVLDLNKTISGMLNMLQRLIGEDISLDWNPNADLWPVKVDPSQIDQILANLCVNARDAIAGVGKVTIETENSALDDDYCATHAGFVSGEYVRLAISDNGCGMDKETLSHLFEPFYTTKEAGKGTGLGLATVYGIVKQNNGLINVYSEPGQGTTFTIYLPRHIGKNHQHQTEGAPQSVGRGHETILLAEDEPALLELTTKMLKRQGYRVLAASTPGEAIRLAREHSGEINLLMTDVIMPEMNGRDLAKNLLALYPHMKRLFMSGYTADVIAHHGVLDEGVHFMQKPFSRKYLADKVREALDQE
jgi:PAS domain S-box-containing protein